MTPITISVYKVGKAYGVTSQFENRPYTVGPSVKAQTAANMVKRDIAYFESEKIPWVLRECPNNVRELLGMVKLVGRPRLFEKGMSLPVIEVSREMRDRLVDLAHKRAISVPKLRREAYQKIIDQP